MVMLENKKTKSQIIENLNAFFGDQSSFFVEW